MDHEIKESLIEKNPDPLISRLNALVVASVKVLAVLMTLVIWLALFDVIVHMYNMLWTTMPSFFAVESLISTLGDFLAVLIAIEIFLNIIFYLKEDAIHVPLVLATALTAVARKVIIFDYKLSDPHLIYATATVIFALGLTYWLVTKKSS